VKLDDDDDDDDDDDGVWQIYSKQHQVIQYPGRFLGILGQIPSVAKSKNSHV